MSGSGRSPRRASPHYVVEAFAVYVTFVGDVLRRIYEMYPDICRANDAFLRVAMQFENYDRHYASRVHDIGVGRGRGIRRAVPRALIRSDVYARLLATSTAQRDLVREATGFPRPIFEQFAAFVGPALSGLPARRGLNLHDRLTLFFKRCRKNCTLAQLEAAHGVSVTALSIDFHHILRALDAFLVKGPQRLINAWPYCCDDLARDNAAVPLPSRHVHPADNTAGARRLRLLAPLGIVGLIDGMMVDICRPITRMAEREDGVNHQREHYSGYKKRTAFTFLVISDVRGRVLGTFGPYGGRQNDRALFNSSPIMYSWGSLFDSSRHVLLADAGFAGRGNVMNNFGKRQLNAGMLLRSKTPEEAAAIIAGRLAHNAGVKFFRSCIEHLFSVLKGKYNCLRFASGIVHRQALGRLVHILFAVVRFMQDHGHGIPRGTESYFNAQVKAWMNDCPGNYMEAAREKVNEALRASAASVRPTRQGPSVRTRPARPTRQRSSRPTRPSQD